jgi:hypothetical protein
MRLMHVAIAALICVAIHPSVAWAQDDAFKKGLQAKNDKNWAEMAKQMRAAIDANPTESTTKKVKPSGGITGFLREGVEYLPYYFLGEALNNQNDCAGAVAAWGKSLDQRVVRGKAEFFEAIQRGFKDCAGRGVLLPGEFDTQSAASQKAYESALAILKRVENLRDTHKDLWPPFAQQMEAARKELQSAYEKLTQAQRTRLGADFNESKAADERATVTLRSLEEAVNTAIDNLASIQQKIRDAGDAIAAADVIDKSIDGIKTTLTEPLAASRKSGREQLAQARDKLATGQKTQNAAPVSEATKLAQSASGIFNQIVEQLKRAQRTDLEQRLSVVVRAADETFAAFSALMTTFEDRAAQKQEKVTPEMATQRDAIRKQIETLRQRYDRSRKAEDVAGIESVTKQAFEARTALDQIIQAFGPLSLRDRGVHAGLEEGARMFLTGEYQKAVAALDPATGVDEGPNPSLQLQAHLFRAASLFALYVRSGESRQEYRTQALAEIEQCKQINGTFEPDAKIFAPRFIALYKTGGAAASQTASATQ